jgi:hypothetical protein
MKRTKLAGWLACALVALALPSWCYAQAPRTDAIWARSTAGQTIKLDGVLDEFAWSKAETWILRYGVNNGDPGSGWKDEAGRIAKDSTYATLKFLVNGNKLYLGAVMRDSSIGGSATFNRFDGLLMAIKDHRDPFATISGPIEYLYSWWHPEASAPDSIGIMPGFRGYWSSQSDTIPRTQEQIDAWNAVTKVRGGQANDDLAGPDSSWVVEMVFDVGMMGYTPTAANGDIIEWNLSVYDTDWFWPLSGPRFSSNRSWWQGPWGNQMHLNEVRIYTRPSVTINSGAAPIIGPEVRIPNANSYAAPNIDGFLTDPVWANTLGFDIRYGDFDVRQTYPGVMRWRSAFYQPPVNGGTAAVIDPGDATIKWFFKGDSLYIGFDVRDQVVQNHALFDRNDGFIVTLQDTAISSVDHNKVSRRLGFHVGPAPSGAAVATDYLPYLRDTVFAAKLGLKLKPGTTVDTLGLSPDQGYTAELMVNLRKLGFPAGLGTKPLYIGIDMQDGDSFVPFTDSYGTRTWWGREYEGECCPANAYLDPTRSVGIEDEAIPARSGLIGNFPNPFRTSTMVKFALANPAHVTFEVYDLQGRQVARRALGFQASGARQAAFTGSGLGTGIYLYRLKLTDPVTGAARGSMAGKMMILN